MEKLQKNDDIRRTTRIIQLDEMLRGCEKACWFFAGYGERQFFFFESGHQFYFRSDMFWSANGTKTRLLNKTKTEQFYWNSSRTSRRWFTPGF